MSHLTFLLWIPPGLLFFSAAIGRRLPLAKAQFLANVSTAAALLAGLALLVIFALSETDPAPALGLGFSWLSLSILLLLNFIGLILVRYSKNYLAGEPGQGAFLGHLQFTLTAVSITVLADHLLLLWLGLIGISLMLHRLLMFYPERPRVALASHKKFILARLAEALLLVAILLLYQQHQGFSLSSILAEAQSRPLTMLEQTAMVFIALVALIKCAQLPLHGWLIQVVEAPTPVSALLHGGIINLGGFLLILFAPLLSKAGIALGVILVWGGLSTVLAALIMTTQASIKVKLAWSTCAQMGLMLVECGLGLFHLAWLHLLAHSLYKAYAFLYSGHQVRRYVGEQAAGKPVASARQGWINGLLAISIIGAIDWLWPWPYRFSLALTLFSIMAIALVLGQARANNRFRFLGYALLVAFSHQALNSTGDALYPWPRIALPWAEYWLSFLALALMAGYLKLKHSSGYQGGNRMRGYFFAGLFLDEWLTRLTLRLWPTELPKRAKAKFFIPSTQEQMP